MEDKIQDAEGAKVTQRTQKREEKIREKEGRILKNRI
jgi:hypothetical protein